MPTSSNVDSDTSSKEPSSPQQNKLVGITILVGAQLAAASTATCVHALPSNTPSVLRGLWRQLLTSIIFALMALMVLSRKNKGKEDQNAASNEEGIGDVEHDEEQKQALVSTSNRLAYAFTIVMAIVGATVLNDSIVIALKYASSAAVMCLCNTTPVWLILYAILTCNPPGIATVAGAALSLVGAIICATGDGGQGGEVGVSEKASDSDGVIALNADRNLGALQSLQSSIGGESLGSMIATVGAIGSALYMTSCRKLAPVGLHPVILSLMVNVGMALTSYLLSVSTLEGGVSILSTDITNGLFGFLNPAANPAALFHSVFPDCFGNFGIMLALGYFEPLIVSLVMLVEPLNASIIAMIVVGEDPPRRRTVLGVLVVLLGCAIVLWESSKDGKEAEEAEKQDDQMALVEPMKRASTVRRRTSQVVLLSPIGTVAPDVTAKAAWRRPSTMAKEVRRYTVPVSVLRHISLSMQEREESALRLQRSSLMSASSTSSSGTSTRRSTFPAALLQQNRSSSVASSGDDTDTDTAEEAGNARRPSSRRNLLRLGSSQNYGTIEEEGVDEEGGSNRKSEV